MAYAGLNTQGFQVGVVPQAPSINPALFNALGPLSQGLASGIGSGVQLQDIAMRRQQMEQEQAFRRRQEEQEQLLRPLRNALLTAQVNKAQQQAAMPDILWGDSTLQDLSVAGPEAQFGDIVQVDTGVEYLPGGGTRPVTRRKTIKTAAERRVEEDTALEAKAKQRLAEQNAQTKADEAAKAAAALIKLREAQAKKAVADAAKALRPQNPASRTFPNLDGRRVIEYFDPANPSVVLNRVDAGAPAAVGGFVSPFGAGGTVPAGPITNQQFQDATAQLWGAAPAAGGAAPAPAPLPAAGGAAPAGARAPAAPFNFALDFNPRGAAPVAAEEAPAAEVNVDPQDVEAYQWAQANPDDPRAAQIEALIRNKYGL